MSGYQAKPIQDHENIKNMVDKINEMMPHVEKVGDLSELNTTNKSSIVKAINEVTNSKVDSSTVGNLNNLQTNNKSSVVEAINENRGKINELSSELENAKADTVENANYSTLQERLDNYSDKIGILNEQLAGKADKTYVDTSIQSVASAPPKGTVNFNTNNARLVIPVGVDKYATK